MDYVIIDNFLSKEDFNNIKTRMVDSNQFPWFYSNIVDDSNDFQLVHSFYDFWNWQGDDVWVWVRVRV